MHVVEKIKQLGEDVLIAAMRRANLMDRIFLGRASAHIRHMRPRNFLRDPVTGLYTIPDPDSFFDVDEPELVFNVITNVGRVQLHKQGYDTSGLATNGFNYIALSNDALTETSASTTLSNEITLNGLGRAQGTVTLASGAGNQTTIAKTFTASGSQSAQKAALFNLSAVGVMNHALAFTQRALITNDTLTVTYTITLG